MGRISQEHGTVTWKGNPATAGMAGMAGMGTQEEGKFEVGQKIRVWPNHACIAGAGFGWYFVVDGGDEVVDVWPRWRGW
jgi:D-serine deaminase-like pyridoxal phosphate-dependent protein